MRKKYGFGLENTGTLTDTLQTWRVVSSRADVTAAVRKKREVFRRTHINHNYRVVGTVPGCSFDFQGVSCHKSLLILLLFSVSY